MQLSELILTYEKHPDLFVEDLLGVTPQDWQREVMSAVAKGQRRCSIRSGHGVGKSSCASWLMIWFLLKVSGQDRGHSTNSIPTVRCFVCGVQTLDQGTPHSHQIFIGDEVGPD